jgi:hypothetical protein
VRFLIRSWSFARRNPVALAGYLLYFWTAAPGIGASDTALLVDEMRNLRYSTHANHHNLTITLGWLASHLPGSAARLATLVQSFLGGTAVLLFYLLVLRTFGRRRVAVLATLGLLVLHSLWWHSTIAEVYAANAVLTVVALFLIVRLREVGSPRGLPPLFFVAGFALFNHVQMGIVAVGATVALVWSLLLDLRRGAPAEAARLAVRCTLAFVLGFLPYALVFAMDMRLLGGFRPALAQALGGDFRRLMFSGGVLAAVADLGFLLVWQFSLAFLVVIAFGIRRLLRAFAGSPALGALLGMFLLNTGFFAFFPTWDKYAFLLPSFIVLAFAGAHALDALDRRLEAEPRGSLVAAGLGLLFVLQPLLLYPRLTALSAYGGRLARFGHERTKNLFDEGLYLADPDKRGFAEYQDCARAILAKLPTNAVYVDDDSRTYYVIRHLQRYEGARTDFRLELVNDWGFEGWGISRSGFVDLVRAARDGRVALFLADLEDPYLPYLMAVPGIDGYHFRRFPLDERRWVYRLVPRNEEGALVPEAPRPAALLVGEGFGSPGARLRADFGPNDPVAAELRFDRNGEPFTLGFRWRGPEGREAAATPIRIPFGCVTAYGTLEAPRPLVPGTWTVTAEASGTTLASARFNVGR